MKKRIIAIIALLTLALTALSACAKPNYGFTGKTYIYEKITGDSAFSITINEDGTFTYTEGTVGTYNANGKWTYQDGIITLDDNLSEDFNFVNNFIYSDGALVFFSEGSTNFPTVTVEDGDKFICISSK